MRSIGLFRTEGASLEAKLVVASLALSLQHQRKLEEIEITTEPTS